MNEHVFTSSLTEEETIANFQNVDFFSELSEGLKEAIAYEKGQANPKIAVRKRSLPTIDVAALRKALNMTQVAFSSILGVSSRTVEAWESGRSTPTPTAKKLMSLIQEDHSLVSRLQY